MNAELLILPVSPTTCTVPNDLLHKSCLKKVFSPELGITASPQVLDILMHARAPIPDRVLISTENPNFEITSSQP